MVATVSPGELHRRQQSDASLELLDVRTPAEFAEVHVSYARNVPLDRLDAVALVKQRQTRLAEPLYVICRSGNRAQQAAEKLMAAGFEQVVNVAGGTQACVAAGLPVTRGKATMSLERQVRIAAGTLVILGAVLGYFVHPLWIALAAFVGAGLVYAGVTDTCGMGMLLARMPWNTRCGETAACSVNRDASVHGAQ